MKLTQERLEIARAEHNIYVERAESRHWIDTVTGPGSWAKVHGRDLIDAVHDLLAENRQLSDKLRDAEVAVRALVDSGARSRRGSE